MTPPYFFVFDVESVGLHGEGFAFGFVILDRDGQTLKEGGYQCDPNTAACIAKYDQGEGRKWIKENLPPLNLTELGGPVELRSVFWSIWEKAKLTYLGIVMLADCAWPVEARFLIDCVNDPGERTWGGPYPLHDLASICLALGLDPLATNERLPSEMPAHNPVMDARQSARLLIEALKMKGQGK